MRKYYFVVYSWVNPSEKTTGQGNIAISFDSGDFSPAKAIYVISQSVPGLEHIFLINWKEISAEAWTEWNTVIEGSESLN